MKIFFSILLFLSIYFPAQTHRFIYEYQFKADSTVADYHKENMALDINPDEVKFYPYFQIKNDSLNKIPGQSNYMWDDDIPTLKRTLNSSANENYFFPDAYFKTKTTDVIDWKLSSETKRVNDYLLQMATCNFGGRFWTAWFNPEIPINEGPYKFRGLPGLIFEIKDSNDYFKFTLVKSQKLKNTFSTVEFLETFVGQKPILISEEIYTKKSLDNYNDPLRDMRESFKKNTNPENNFWSGGIKIERLDQFKELTELSQKRIRKENNHIERKDNIHYPTK